ncbi:MAG: ABC transporter ATP-binding protein [Alphaproteobacteria bacterium]|nr:ABC transporter ATP-binding protein [Alphaproteobacteria bacterium]
MTAPGTPAILEVDDLRVAFPTRGGLVHAVRGVSFSVGREKVAIVGESGSGKSMTGRAIIGAVPRTGTVTAKRLAFDGMDLLALPPARRRALAGRRIAMVLQDPKFSLNPVMRVGEQIAEGFRVHGIARGAEARDRALAMLEAVRIRDPGRVYRAYPHELSGGMGQRAMIAMMLAPGPDLLIADEPTSALDVTVQAQVLAIIDDLVSRSGMGLIFISHDLDLVARFCDRVIVMLAGRIVESVAASDLRRVSHPYAQGLLRCVPRIDGGQGDLPTLSRDAIWRAEGSAP